LRFTQDSFSVGMPVILVVAWSSILQFVINVGPAATLGWVEWRS